MVGNWSSASISLKCTVVTNVVFWPLALMGLYVDHLSASGAFPRLTQFKVQPNKHLSGRERGDLILLASFNMLVVAPIVCCPMFEAIWNYIQGPAWQDETDEWRWVQELLFKVPTVVDCLREANSCLGSLSVELCSPPLPPGPFFPAALL